MSTNEPKDIKEAVSRMAACINHVGIEFNNLMSFLDKQGIDVLPKAPAAHLDTAFLDSQIGTEEVVVDAGFKGPTGFDIRDVRPGSPLEAEIISEQEASTLTITKGIDVALSEAEASHQYGSHTMAFIAGAPAPTSGTVQLDPTSVRTIDTTRQMHETVVVRPTTMTGDLVAATEKLTSDAPLTARLKLVDSTVDTARTMYNEAAKELAPRAGYEQALNDQFKAFYDANPNQRPLIISVESARKINPEVAALFKIDVMDAYKIRGDRIIYEEASVTTATQIPTHNLSGEALIAAGQKLDTQQIPADLGGPVSALAATLMLDSVGMGTTIGDTPGYEKEAGVVFKIEDIPATENKFKFFDRSAYGSNGGIFRAFFNADVIAGGAGNIGKEKTDSFISAQRYREDIFRIDPARTLGFPLGLYTDSETGGKQLLIPTQYPKQSKTKIIAVFTDIETDDYKIHYTTYTAEGVPSYTELAPNAENSEILFLVVLETLKEHKAFNDVHKLANLG